MVEEALPAPLDAQMGIWCVAMGVTCRERVRTVELEDDIQFVIDIAGDDARHVLLDPPTEAVIAVGGRCQVREVDLDQLILGVVGVSGHGAAGLGGLGFEIAVRVVEVGEVVVLQQPIGGVGDAADEKVPSHTVADPLATYRET